MLVYAHEIVSRQPRLDVSTDSEISNHGFDVSTDSEISNISDMTMLDHFAAVADDAAAPGQPQEEEVLKVLPAHLFTQPSLLPG